MVKKIHIHNIELHLSASDVFYLIEIDNPFHYSHHEDLQENSLYEYLAKNKFSTVKLYPFENYDRKGVFGYFYFLYSCQYFETLRLTHLISNSSYTYMNKQHLAQIETLLELFVQVHKTVLQKVGNQNIISISREQLIQYSIESANSDD